MQHTTTTTANGTHAHTPLTETTVTVIIPFCETYTPREMLDEAIESVDQQLTVDTEVLVINDDDEQGPAWARNTGLDRAETRYVAFLDADDTWFETKLRDQLQEMHRTGSGLCVDGDVNYSPLEFIGALMTGDTFGLTSSILIDTEQTNVRFDESLERREDHLFMIEATADAGVCFVPQTFNDGTHEDGLSNHVDSSPEQIQTFFRNVVDRVPAAAQFRRPYYQSAYVYVGRSRHFDKEYTRAINYFIQSLRYGPNVDAVGAAGLSLLAMAREYSTISARRVLPSRIKSKVGLITNRDR